jgi:predicted nucleic acid-binding Zn ribbon protein
MPIFEYLILNGKNPPQYIEVEHALDDQPLSEHPITGEPVQKVITSPSLTLNHSQEREKKSLSKDHLAKHDFSVFEKNKSGEGYVQTLGK